MKKHRFPTNQKGGALIIVMVLFVMVSLSVAAGLVAPVLYANRIAQNSLHSKRSYFMAESGVEDVVYRLRNSMVVSPTETLVLGNVEAVTTVTDVNSTTKGITSLGDSLNRGRTVAATLVQGEGVSFSYGVQVGRGGLNMSGSSGINGSVYSNGNIYGASSTFITGSAIAANSSSLIADQTNGVTGAPTLSVATGQATATQDIAQSFTISSDAPVNKAQFYVRKTGSPSNATVTIVADNSGVPSTTVLATGTLSASLVTASYGWIGVIFTTNPQLYAGTTYWVVVDTAVSGSNYYTLAANNNGYSLGALKMGRVGSSWSNPSPSTTDIYFNMYTGGVVGRIYGDGPSSQLDVGTGGSGIAKANTVNNVTVSGALYCQTGTGNNKSCNTSQTDPVEQPWPVSDANIESLQDDAEVGGTLVGNTTIGSSQSVTLGPKKIDGNLTINGSATVTLTGTLWVTGNLEISGSGKLKLSTTYGANDGAVIVDGRVTIGGSSPITGSGTTGSYIMILSTSECPNNPVCSGQDAIDVSGSAGAVILVAQNGTISFSGSASAKQATGYALELNGSTTVTYESGLTDMQFTSGPSGSWDIDSWKETE